MRGDVTATDRALTLAQAGGLAAVAMLRMLLGHLQRLHKASLAVAGGQSPAETVQTMRPPVFYRRQPDFVRALELWRPEHIMAAMESVFAAEQGCKRTGAPDAALSAHALLAVAGRAAQLRRASRGSAA
jgi:DNA polymerase-3 subunit delta